MSIDSLRQVIARAAAEPEFLNLLCRNSAAALADYDLSAAEMAMVTGLTPETFDALARELDQRASLSVIWGTRSSPRP
jgi:hypothetical protein